MNGWLIGGTAVLSAALGGYFFGNHVASLACEVDKAELAENAKIDYDAATDRLIEVSNQFEKARYERNRFSRALARQAADIDSRPLYQSACFDDDGLRIANDALRGRPADPGQLDPAVPTAIPAR